MKKSKNKKFIFEKFEVAKLNNLKSIKAGDSSNICTTTDTRDPDASDKPKPNNPKIPNNPNPNPNPGGSN
ncbi:conserved hypothetical protein [Flavobacterium sp. 9AF]|uniref:hypothetical protein n=1 Tax=Flavobacterium sp. 9AF TaxID=2653142 RepID=UPI0012F1D340|nr:hypothetical protein [Flavobacterium sp. 9AF]VXB14445.1 conserved hypothetical protein [Flavobacterium sp. 9AF]